MADVIAELLAPSAGAKRRLAWRSHARFFLESSLFQVLVLACMTHATMAFAPLQTTTRSSSGSNLRPYPHIDSSTTTAIVPWRTPVTIRSATRREQPPRLQVLSTTLDTAVVEYDDFLPQPNPQLGALDVVHSCMSVLLDRKDAGLEVCFNFSSDRCRAALGGSLDNFRQYATNPVFGYLVNCDDYTIVSVGPVIAGTPTRGAMQTVLMDAQTMRMEPPPPPTRGIGRARVNKTKKESTPAQPKLEDRRFLWTLQKERRPPRQDCWVIHEVIYVPNAIDLTM